MNDTKNFPGLDGFVWWTGIVEDRIDPLKIGRVRVRIFGWHSDEKNDLPSDGLLWAQPVMAANVYQIAHVPKEGEVLFGFFMDGEYAQVPFYMGVIPNIPEIQYPSNKGFSDPGTEEEIKKRPKTLHSGQTRYPGKGELNQPTFSRSARNENMEQTPFKEGHEGSYPYVFSIQSESGHYIDLDDTLDKERITIIHRSGSRIDFQPNGDIDIYSIRDVNITAKYNVNITALEENIRERAMIDIVEYAGRDISEGAGRDILEHAGEKIESIAGTSISEIAAKDITQKSPKITDDTIDHQTTGIHEDKTGFHV